MVVEGSFFSQGDYFVAVGMNLISSETQLFRKTLGIYTRVDPRVNCAGLR